MHSLKIACQKLINKKNFEWLVVLVILVNSALIIAGTYTHYDAFDNIQNVILGIFTVEIIIRFIAARSVKEFFRSGWHNFDLFLIITGFLPEAWFPTGSGLLIFRFLRILRVLRLMRTSDELKLILAVLLRSFRTLAYNAMFFFIFFFMYATLGVTLFRVSDPQTIAAKSEAYQSYLAANSTIHASDPYGSFTESMFTLFRVMTGDDWTLVCYNLQAASKDGLIQASPGLIAIFHVTWFILAAFLLLNLFVGAVVNNYQVIIEETRQKKAAEKARAAPQPEPVETT